MLKHVKAIEMKRHNDLATNAQEREALASDAYREALEADANAAANLAFYKARIEAAKMTIEVWRTESATERASYA